MRKESFYRASITFVFLVSLGIACVLNSSSQIEENTEQKSHVNVLGQTAKRAMRDNALLYSSQYCQWRDDYSEFNCYAFALRRPDVYGFYYANCGYQFSYGNYFPAQIGDFSGSYPRFPYGPLGQTASTPGMSCSASDLVPTIEEDLEALGFAVVSVSTTPPTSLSDSHELIAFRVSEDGTDDDYHFMRWGKDGYWYHKPGNTLPLRYEAQTTMALSNSVPWYSESIDENGIVTSIYDGYVYTSDIWYFVYSVPKLTYSALGWNSKSFSVGCQEEGGFDLVVSDAAPQTFTFSGNYAFDISLYDANLNAVYSGNNNVQGYSVTFKLSLPVGRYRGYVRHYASSVKTASLQVRHVHAETYSWSNLSSHLAICSECGNSESEPHVFSHSEPPDAQGRRTCLLCGGKGTFGTIMGTMPGGSSIDENGAVLLSENDLASYLSEESDLENEWRLFDEE